MFSSLFQDEGAGETSDNGEISPLHGTAFPSEIYCSDATDAFFDWQNALCSEEANRSSLENSDNPVHDYHISSSEAAFLSCLSEEFNGYFAQTDSQYGSAGQLQNSQLPMQQLTQSQPMNRMLKHSESQDTSGLLDPLDSQMMISMADVLPQAQSTDAELQQLPSLAPSEATTPADKKPKEKKSTKERSSKKTSAVVTATPVAKKIGIPNNYMNLLQLASAADVGMPEFLSGAPGVEVTEEKLMAVPSDRLTAAPSHDELSSNFGSFISDGHCNEQNLNDKDLKTPETPSEFAFLHDTESQDMDFHEDSLKLEAPVCMPIQHPQLPQQQTHQMSHPYHIQTPQHRPSTSTSAIRNKREKPATHTPRPPNSFIIYRKEKHAELMSQSTGTSTLNNNVISKIVGTMWKQEPPEIKARYAAKAQEEKRIHMLKHPDYKYRPKKAPPKQGSEARASSASVPEPSSMPLQRFVKMQPMSNAQPLSHSGMQQSHQHSLVGGSIAALPPAMPGSASHGAGGMGMAVSALEDFQYCQMGSEFFPMHQAMYTGGYPSFDQSMWADGSDAGNGFVYWTQAQMPQQNQQQQQQPQQQPPPSQGFVFDQDS
ncbi:hypothetical protein HDU78_004226 [Chytriomyces hyalinus]|nr:hypothetical protein HDU78_004226 [Chytriomyces hyalinus]